MNTRPPSLSLRRIAASLCLAFVLLPTGLLLPRRASARDSGHAPNGPAVGPADQRLPAYGSAARVARTLKNALEANELTQFDELLKAPSPSLIEVAAILLNPRDRIPSEADLAVLARMREHAPANTRVSEYIDHWQSASDEERAAERALWGLSARYAMANRAGKKQEAQDLIGVELERIRGLKFSQQAVNILRSYTSTLIIEGKHKVAEEELRGIIAHLREERRFHEQLPLLILLSRALRGQSREAEAAEIDAQAQGSAEDLGIWRQATLLSIQRGWHAKNLGNARESEQHLQHALALAGASSHERLGHVARVALARVAWADGRTNIAELHAKRAFSQTKDSPRPTRAADAAAMLVTLMQDNGRLAEAHAYGIWLEDNVHKLKMHEAVGIANRAIGRLALQRGDVPAARTHLEAALKAFAGAARGAHGEISALHALLNVEPLPADVRAMYLAQYRKLVKTSSTGSRGPWILAGAAEVERRIGDREAARRLAQRALTTARASSDALVQHRGIAAMAEDLAADGKWDVALPLFAEARALAPAGSHSVVSYRVSEGRGLLALHRPKEAVAAFRSALETHAPSRRGVSNAVAMQVRAQEHNVASLGVQAAAKWQASDPEATDAAVRAAWWFRERGSSRLLAESIARGSASRTDQAALAGALDTVEATQRRLVVAIARGAADKFVSLRTELARGVEELRKISRREGARGSRPNAFDALSIEEVQASLTEKDAVLAYAVSSEAVFGIAIDRKGASLRRLGATPQLRNLVVRWRTLASTPDGPDTKLATLLYDQLVRPFEARLHGRLAWTVLAEGPLAGVPIDAWLRKDEAQAVRIIENHVVSYAHSDSVRTALQERGAARAQGRGVLTLGDPTYPMPDPGRRLEDRPSIAMRLRSGLALPRLPASGDEARQVAALYPATDRTTLIGAHATRDGLLAALAQRDNPLRALHLACHGIVDNEFPTLSGLVFTGGHVLTTERLAAMRIDADLVVLSACDSGSGKQSVGEGILGLTRGLFLAGVSQVICTTWQVADKNAAVLMVRFHQGRERDGKDAATALREARLSLMKDPRTAHPFYWAGLQLWGAK